MNLRARIRRLGLLGLCALAWGGCSGDETIVTCLSSCDVTVALATPLSGREFAISVGFPDGSVQQIDCQPGDGSVACIPLRSRVEATFAADGALHALKIAYPDAGPYAVQIDVDGAPAAAGTFSHQTPPSYGDPCRGGSAAVSCVPETFTIGN
jgi:hypothetical protein